MLTQYKIEVKKPHSGGYLVLLYGRFIFFGKWKLEKHVTCETMYPEAVMQVAALQKAFNVPEKRCLINY